MKSEDISSIGWLYGENDTVKLSVVKQNEMTPVFVTISREEFKNIRHDKELWKQKALDVLNG